MARPVLEPPSGTIEAGETPAQGAVRELREESGLLASPDALELVWTTKTVVDGRPSSRSWNYVTNVSDPTFAVDDPDGSVMDVRWIPVANAVRLLEAMPYPPIAVPAVHYLTHATAGRNWHFTLTDEQWTW